MLGKLKKKAAVKASKTIVKAAKTAGVTKKTTKKRKR